MAEIEFTRLGDGREIAFRRHSGAPGPTMIYFPTGTVPIEVMGEDPMEDRFLRTLGRYGSLFSLDRLGSGASDALDPEIDYLDQLADSFVAIVDEVGVDTAWMIGGNTNAGVLGRLATRHPGRVAGGALLNPGDYARPGPWAPAATDRMLDRDQSTGDNVLRDLMPSRADDPAFREYHARAGRLGASASAARVFWEAVFSANEALTEEIDGPVDVTWPVLVMRRRDFVYYDDKSAEWWSKLFPSGELMLIEGTDLGFLGLDAGLVGDTIGGFITGTRREPVADRPLLAVLFVDLVSSTEQVSAVGDTSWRARLDRYERTVKDTVSRHGGRLVKFTGDGAIATFATGTNALDAAVDLRSQTHELGLEGRSGIHVGEVEMRGDDIGGVAVHLAARVMGHAQPGEVLTSSSTAHTVVGSPHTLESLGLVELKGLDRPWELYELQDLITQP